VGFIHEAYRDWYLTQFSKDEPAFAEWYAFGREPATWLWQVPELHAARAPGNTCLNALSMRQYGTPEAALNNSKGCGGVMRVAPVGLFHKGEQSRQQLMSLGWEAARAAAITHGHPLGYISAAALAVMVNRAAYGGCPYEDGLYGILRECMELLGEMFGQEPELSLQLRLLEQAAERSRNGLPNAENIAALGEGWVGEEALAIAVYCCLRHQDDFSEAVIAAVNHDGDSDSTGAVCGNLLGAWLGAEAIAPRWLEQLELADVIGELSRDLCDCCLVDAQGRIDESWLRKYARAGRE
jgi:ADP-ribosylglycohydrolase